MIVLVIKVMNGNTTLLYTEERVQQTKQLFYILDTIQMKIHIQPIYF